MKITLEIKDKEEFEALSWALAIGRERLFELCDGLIRNDAEISRAYREKANWSQTKDHLIDLHQAKAQVVGRLSDRLSHEHQAWFYQKPR